MNQSFKDPVFLISELNKGNKLAYKFLYTNYYHELFVYAKSFVKDGSLAEDIVQEVMISVLNKKPNIKITSSVKSYLYRAVYYNVISANRAKQKDIQFANEVKAKSLSYFANEDSDLINKRIALVKQEIEKLPPKCKEVFLLNKVSGLKYKEIAIDLNISIKTVEKHISSARQRIKKSLKNYSL